jgi:DNA-binding transcriptional MocR family regulator
VILCSSFGITLAPSLRVGWCAPAGISSACGGSSSPTRSVRPSCCRRPVSDFLRNGGYDHHLRSIPARIPSPTPPLLAGDPALLPGGYAAQPAGGWIRALGRDAVGVDTLRLHREALKHHINTAPGAIFSVKDRYRNCLRMNCGLPWNETIENALRTLGELAKRHL